MSTPSEKSGGAGLSTQPEDNNEDSEDLRRSSRSSRKRARVR